MNINMFQEFLNSLTEEQRAAVLFCKTEEEFDKAADDYDIDLPDELMAEVAGGKGLIPSILAAVVMLSGGSAIAAGASEAPGQSDGGIAVSATYEEDASEGSHKFEMVENPDGTTSFVRQVRSDSGVWETEVSKARSAVTANLCFDEKSGISNIASRTIKIYGRRIIDMDEKGGFIYGREELLKSQTSSFGRDFLWTFGADVDLDSVRIEFSHKAFFSRQTITEFVEIAGNSLPLTQNKGCRIQIEDNIYLRDILGNVENTDDIECICIGSCQFGLKLAPVFVTSGYDKADDFYQPQAGYAFVEMKEGIPSESVIKLVHNCEYCKYDFISAAATYNYK